MNSKQAPNKGKQQHPSKIYFIQDKKIEKNGSIQYLVRYKNSEHSQWVSKKYLCVDPENTRCIQRYQILMKADLDMSDNEDSKKRKKQLQSKTKIIRKPKQDLSKIQELKLRNAKKGSQQNTTNISKEIMPPLKINVSQQEQIDQIQEESKFKQQKSTQKSVQKPKAQKKFEKRQITLNKKHQKKKALQQQFEFEVQQQKPEHKEVLIPKEFKIIRAQINIQGKINFQIKSENGQALWIDGNYLKQEYPNEVIRFYEKKITWSC